MEIIIGKNSGFCYGVTRAVNNAEKHAKKEKLNCLGEIVHNQNIIHKLEDLGIKFIKNIDEADSTTIIRAHGEPKTVYKTAKERNIKLIDLTCPSVLKIHGIVRKFAKKNYFIIITGKENHPEVLGIKSYAEESCIIIGSVSELNKNLSEILKKRNILLISQTTFSLKEFKEIENILRININKNNNLVVKNTICVTTENKQKETKEIAKSVNAMIIVGDKRSANTNELYNTACKYCDNTQFVLNEKELDLKRIRKNYKIGIMAGASTPKEDILKIKNTLLKSDKIDL